jgi:hypothetical protein
MSQMVKLGKAQYEQMFSGLHPKADIGRTHGGEDLPNPTSCERPLCAQNRPFDIYQFAGTGSACGYRDGDKVSPFHRPL